MHAIVRSSRRLRRIPLTRALLLALSFAAQAEILAHGQAPDAGAGVDASRDADPHVGMAVVNCNDSGAGSLREAIGATVDGDTIDLSALACSGITLGTGALVVTQDNLVLQGPAGGLTIGAARASEVLVHIGSGTLTLDHLRISEGSKYIGADQGLDARGGCIVSAGTVSLQSTQVVDCQLGNGSATQAARGAAIYATTGVSMISSEVSNSAILAEFDATGGGISTPGDLVMVDSSISVSLAHSNSGLARGGAADVGGLFIAKYSSIAENAALSGSDGGSAGAIYAGGDVQIVGTSVAHNQSATAGAIEMRGSGQVRSITNSTIAGNRSQGVAGVLAAGSDLAVSNTTIAYNAAVNSGTGSGLFAEGVNVELQSSLLAFNGDREAGQFADVSGSGTLSGSNNLIFNSLLPVPAGTIEHVDSLTRAVLLADARVVVELKPGSPALDAGNNAAALDFDQRGSGHPRVFGIAADIGSFEFDLDDLVFAGGFD